MAWSLAVFKVGTKIKFYISMMIVLSSTFTSLFLYPGSAIIFLLFSAVFCLFLLRSLNLNSFFIFYLALLMWLGFWFKLMGSLFFNQGLLFESTGLFDYSPNQWDSVLFTSSVGCAGFLVASLFAGKGKVINRDIHSTHIFRSRHYKYYWLALVFFSVIIFFLNAHYGVFQKTGKIESNLPVYFALPIKWMIFLGLNIAAVSLLYWGVQARVKGLFFYLSIALTIDLLCNITSLSRAFPLTGGAIAFSFFLISYSSEKKFWVKVLLIAALYLFFSAASILAVNYQRSIKFVGADSSLSSSLSSVDTSVVKAALPGVKFLFGRWVGLEGVAAISSSGNLGFNRLIEASSEKKTNSRPSFYDLNVLSSTSPYLDIGLRSYYAITLPGLIGFITYSGSVLFVFFATFGFGVLGIWVERCSWFFTHNALAVSFLSFLWAYRYASFGYAPIESYQIIISFLLLYCISLAIRGMKLFTLP